MTIASKGKKGNIKMKSCENCGDNLCRETLQELCKDSDTGVWNWSFWIKKDN